MSSADLSRGVSNSCNRGFINPLKGGLSSCSRGLTNSCSRCFFQQSQQQTQQKSHESSSLNTLVVGLCRVLEQSLFRLSVWSLWCDCGCPSLGECCIDGCEKSVRGWGLEFVRKL